MEAAAETETCSVEVIGFGRDDSVRHTLPEDISFCVKFDDMYGDVWD